MRFAVAMASLSMRTLAAAAVGIVAERWECRRRGCDPVECDGNVFCRRCLRARPR